ncbi:hypothetical protein IPZ58_10960 [Streptomyces roseoverticillatus]|uniref:hypothetical protein n=1 Tax=Streptomyces roseoverticillatus TaxID=66429 RepID=UPI001F175195|nr:hypothetical protein [Streptomyces roseoverticillatus]MCF3102104.1 hypothetical protein [Streptomyces roseoverticillatus]
MAAPIEFEVTYEPPSPVVTVQATGLSDKTLTVKVTDLDLSKVIFHPKTPLSSVLSGLVNDLAGKAPGIVKGKVTGLSPDIDLDKPIGCDIPIGDSTVHVGLTSPALGTHGDMLMISGTADVS